jgi:type IV pilus assembly protein PilV
MVRSKLSECARAHRAQRGVSLIEVLVTVTIVSLGLLGLGGLQATGMRASQSSLYRSQAAQYASDMIERMRASATPATVGAYNQGMIDRATYTPASGIVGADIAAWLTRLQSLPGGRGKIEAQNNNTVVTVTVEWNDSRVKDTNLRQGAGTATFAVTTQLWSN